MEHTRAKASNNNYDFRLIMFYVLYSAHAFIGIPCIVCVRANSFKYYMFFVLFHTAICNCDVSARARLHQNLLIHVHVVGN